jgi:hypothetical protein
MTEKQIYQKIVTGEFYWKGNLETLVQHTEIKVMPPAIDQRGKKLPAKIIIESWLEDRDNKQQRDHFSIRISSFQEFISLFTALILALKTYVTLTPIKLDYAYGKLLKRIKETWIYGKYDHMIRR